MSQPEPPRRTLVVRAISDIQGSIHANDSKSAAGLVVQGLLATAAVTVASRLGATYAKGTPAAQTLIKIGLIGMLLSAVASIFFLIKAVRPYEPVGINDRLDHYSPRVFFPKIRELSRIARAGGLDELRQLKPAYERLLSDDTLEDEYLVELIKVADIRASEADSARFGFNLLGVEVVFAALYLATVGCVAGGMLGARVADASTTPDASLHWIVAQAGHRYATAGGGELMLSGRGGVGVALVLEDSSQLRDVRLRGLAQYRCPQPDRVGVGSTERTSQEVAPVGASGIKMPATLRVQAHPCKGRVRTAASVRARFVAETEGPSGVGVGGVLTVRARP